MVLGDPAVAGTTFHPQVPKGNGLVEALGCHLGCTLIRFDIFRDKRWGKDVPMPWFYENKPLGKPDAGLEEGQDTGITGDGVSPDVAFSWAVTRLGYKIAVDHGLRCGHFDRSTGRVF